MSEAQPLRSRELLLDDDIRNELHTRVDPLINRALTAHGYLETRRPIRRIELNDGKNSMPSNPYLGVFNRRGFDALSVTTTEDITDSERFLTESSLELHTAGGFAVGQLVSIGNTYKARFIEKNTGEKDPDFITLTSEEASEILEDIRSFTPLGYSSSDTLVPGTTIINELSQLHRAQNIDRKARYEMFTSPDHADIKMNVGESFEIREIKQRQKIQHRRIQATAKKVFELIATQPFGEGEVALGLRYVSAHGDSEAKLTAEINAPNYSDKQIQEYYDTFLEDFQEYDPARFGKSVIKNLELITKLDSSVVRTS